ncbi:MAG: hypothetical protein CO108_10035 [Deltaproteobacteria bacterium CG_4_9_14_3_um_filter_63_12]|nr:MAG: hypothetical protein CO108_10035 [Deltaproteobacteria bacterium CG_4_9_14_3_um_filter_63_12]
MYDSIEKRPAEHVNPPQSAPQDGERAHTVGQDTSLSSNPSNLQAMLLQAMEEEYGLKKQGDLRETAARGVSGSGGAVPFQGEMEAQLGADFSKTRAHVGANATEACEEMGAEAYTRGEDIVFRDTNPKKATVAHELTHVVQQRGGVNLPGGVGQPGDVYERKAQAAERGERKPGESPAKAADATASVTASVTAGIQMKTSEDGEWTSEERQVSQASATYYVGATTNPGYTFDKGTGSGSAYERGDAGFAEEASAAASDMTMAAGKTGEIFSIPKVLPYGDDLSKDSDARAEEAVKYSEKAKDNRNSMGIDRFNEISAWCADDSEQLKLRQTEQESRFQDYNGWTNLANQFFASETRVEALLQIYGVEDANLMVDVLSKGLDDVEATAKLDKAAKNSAGVTETLDIPQPDETLAAGLDDIEISLDELRTAYLGFQAARLLDEKGAIGKQDDDAEKRLTDIKTTKEVIGNVAKTIDGTMGVMNGAGSAIASGANKARKGEAMLNAYAAKLDRMDGGTSNYATQHLSFDASGDPIISDALTGGTLNTETGVQKSPDPYEMNQESLTLPTGVGGVLVSAADFYYKDEVDACLHEIAVVQKKLDSVSKVIEVTKQKAALEALASALTKTSKKLAALEAATVSRRNRLRIFGQQLDSFASSPAREQVLEQERGVCRGEVGNEAASQGCSPMFEDDANSQGTEPGEERYAAILTVSGALDEAYQLGALAAGRPGMTEADWSEFNAGQHRAHPPYPGLKTLKTSTKESAQLVAVRTHVREFERRWQAFGPKVAPLSQKLSGVLSQLTRG